MHQRLLYTGTNKTRLIYASLSTLENNFKAVTHSHPNTEILYLHEGEGFIVTQNEKIKLTKGDFAVISSLCEHREESIIGKEMTFYAIGVNDFGLPEDKAGVTVFSPLNSDGKSLEYSFINVFEELKRNYSLCKDAVNLHTELILIITSRYTLAERGVKVIHGTTLVENAKRFINSRFYATIKAEEMATAMNVSYSTLIHTFKKETGKTITEYKLLKQIDEAKSLLSLTDMSINQIALNVGFSTNTYFSKIFKRETNLTPKEYRERFKE